MVVLGNWCKEITFYFFHKKAELLVTRRIKQLILVYKEFSGKKKEFLAKDLCRYNYLFFMYEKDNDVVRAFLPLCITHLLNFTEFVINSKLYDLRVQVFEKPDNFLIKVEPLQLIFL